MVPRDEFAAWSLAENAAITLLSIGLVVGTVVLNHDQKCCGVNSESVSVWIYLADKVRTASSCAAVIVLWDSLVRYTQKLFWIRTRLHSSAEWRTGTPE